MKRHTLTLLFMVAASMIAMSSSNCSAKTVRLPNSVAKSRYGAKPYYIATLPYIATPHYSAVNRNGT